MTKIWRFVRHNSGTIIGLVLVCLVLAWAYGCESKVVSITNSPVLVTRSGLELEVDHFLKQAEIRFIELDQQDEFKRFIFDVAIGFMQGGDINPIAIATALMSILGTGAVVDNIRKRTLINTLKGLNDKPKDTTKTVS